MAGNVKKTHVRKGDLVNLPEVPASAVRVIAERTSWPSVVRRRFRLAIKGWGFSAEFERENDVQS